MDTYNMICVCCGEIISELRVCTECKATFCETCAVDEITECEECGVLLCYNSHIHEWGDEKHLCNNCWEYKLPEGES